jgi:uncharacterized SAM-binding protein YcdF (DUF218 family)
MNDLPRRAARHPCWRGAAIALAIVIVAALLSWAWHGTLLRGMARWWVVSDSPGHSDAIAVLGGGLEVRPIAAAALYKSGFAGEVLVSSVMAGPAEKEGLLPTESELNRAILVRLGVPPEAISYFGKNLTSTYGEARAPASWAKANGAKSVIIPTELFPSRRVQWIFARELGPEGARAIVIAEPSPRYTIDDWWRADVGIVAFQNEVLKYLYYRVRY